MTEILNRFSFKAAKFDTPVLVCGAFIWLLVLACAISSILKQPFTPRERTLWVLLVVGVPFIGLLAYLPFAIRREDLPQMFLNTPRERPKRTPRGPATSPGVPES